MNMNAKRNHTDMTMRLPLENGKNAGNADNDFSLAVVAETPEKVLPPVIYIVAKKDFVRVLTVTEEAFSVYYLLGGGVSPIETSDRNGANMRHFG